MANAYTPGLKVTQHMIIRKVRRLPIKGQVLVQVGDLVQPDTVVARAQLPGNPHTINVANQLNITPSDIQHYLLRKTGEAFLAGEIIARNNGFLGLGRRELRAPVTGTLELVSGVTGQITLREPPIPVDVTAYIRGRVVEVMPEEGVVVETAGALLQGIFGVGGEHFGTLRVAVSEPTAVLDAEAIRPDDTGKVLVGGSLVTLAAVQKAAQVGAVGIVVGGIVDTDLVAYLGFDIGVAITGHEDIPLALVLTEGFGRITMADKTFHLLQRLAGRDASINGATQIRAGVMRPEIIVSDTQAESTAETESPGLEEGTPIRIIREPYFGQLAEVAELPAELTQIETEAHVRVLRAKLKQSGQLVTIPRANVEIIEER